jgi:hypothetical protein
MMASLFLRLKGCIRNTVGSSSNRLIDQQLITINDTEGPIVRISPREIHICDPEFYAHIYAGGSKRREKDPKFVPVYSMPQSLVATVGHDLHQRRYRVMGSYFSKQSITKREPAINHCIQKLLGRFEQAQKTGECVTLNSAFTAMTGDIITKYSYGKEFGYLEADDYKEKWKAAVRGSLEAGVLFRHFPLLDVFKLLPRRLSQALSPGIEEIFWIEDLVQKQVQDLLLDPTNETKNESTIFDALLGPCEGPSLVIIPLLRM